MTATHPNFLFSLATGAKLLLPAKWNAEERVTRFLGVATQSADLMEAAKSMQTTLSWLEFLAPGGAKRPSA